MAMTFYTSTLIILLSLSGILALTAEDVSVIEAELREYKSGLKEFIQFLERLNSTSVFHNRVKDTFLIPIDEIRNLKNTLVNLNKTVTEHHDKVSELTNQFNTYEKTVNETVSRQEQQIKKLEPQLAVLENQVQNQTSVLIQLRQDLGDLGTRVTQRDNDIQGYDKNYTALEQKFEEQETKYLEVAQQTLQFKTDVRQVMEDYDVLSSVLTGLNDNLTPLEDQISNLANELEQLKSSGPKVTATGDGTSICSRLRKNQ